MIDFEYSLFNEHHSDDCVEEGGGVGDGRTLQ